jgi:uncharacterized protein
MIRVVIDTNVVVSAAISRQGPPAVILDLIAAGKLAPCVSPVLLAEYHDVLTRPHLSLDPARVQSLLEAMERISFHVVPVHRLSVCERDDDDNRVLECAGASDAKYLITGNTKHFPATWKNTKVLTPRQFIEQWKK